MIRGDGGLVSSTVHLLSRKIITNHQQHRVNTLPNVSITGGKPGKIHSSDQTCPRVNLQGHLASSSLRLQEFDAPKNDNFEKPNFEYSLLALSTFSMNRRYYSQIYFPVSSMLLLLTLLVLFVHDLEPLPRVVDQVLDGAVEGQRAARVVQAHHEVCKCDV